MIWNHTKLVIIRGLFFLTIPLFLLAYLLIEFGELLGAIEGDILRDIRFRRCR